MWISYFIPQLLVATSSKFNRDIRVIEERGQPKLLVNGSRQSGPYIKWLWKKALYAFSISKFHPVNSILVLGVGGGTVITLMHSRFPDAEIMGVDIDPVILTIAKKYFSLDTIRNLKFIEGDASKVLPSFIMSKKQFDVIVIDLFFGSDIPKFVSGKTFLGQLKKLKRTNGSILINFLREREYKEKSDALQEKLEALFTTVRDYEVKNNRFFFIQ